MQKSTKIILGLNTLIPPAIIFVFGMYFWNLLVLFDKYMIDRSGILGFGLIADILALYLACLLLSLPVILFYIFHLKKTTRQSDNRKFWILSILFLPVPALQIYWFYFIWRRN